MANPISKGPTLSKQKQVLSVVIMQIYLYSRDSNGENWDLPTNNLLQKICFTMYSSILAGLFLNKALFSPQIYDFIYELTWMSADWWHSC